MKRYTVAIVGLGNRGRTHLKGFLDNSDRFEVAAICDLQEAILKRASERFGISRIYMDAETMLKEVRPDVFCFATLPHIRLELVELAARYGVKALAFEKPMATSIEEAARIRDICNAHGIKAVVSHQQKYITSFQKLKHIVDSGEIGKIDHIHITTQAWLSQLGTHFINYALWAAGQDARARWVVGHVHGKKLLEDSHPSPDYILGEALLDNGIRIYAECGYLSPAYMQGEEKFWVDNRLAVYGSHGHVWADTDGRWGAFTKSSNGQTIGEVGEPWDVQADRIQAPYLADLARWLDHDQDVHSCNVNTAFHGHEILEAVCLSALEHQAIHLPLDHSHYGDVISRMRAELS